MGGSGSDVFAATNDKPNWGSGIGAEAGFHANAEECCSESIKEVSPWDKRRLSFGHGGVKAQAIGVGWPP